MSTREMSTHEMSTLEILTMRCLPMRYPPMKRLPTTCPPKCATTHILTTDIHLQETLSSLDTPTRAGTVTAITVPVPPMAAFQALTRKTQLWLGDP